MNELAPLTIGTVPIGTVLLAQLGLVQNRDIRLDHHVGLAVGERALSRKHILIRIWASSENGFVLKWSE